MFDKIVENAAELVRKGGKSMDSGKTEMRGAPARNRAALRAIGREREEAGYLPILRMISLAMIKTSRMIPT